MKTHKKTVAVVVVIVLGSLAASMLADDGSLPRKGHVLKLGQRVLCPDDGLLLGNGDLSVSVYQTADRIIY